MATGQAISIALKPGLLQLSLHSWPKRWIIGACKTVITQAFQGTRLGIMIWNINKAGLTLISMGGGGGALCPPPIVFPPERLELRPSNFLTFSFYLLAVRKI